MSSVYNFSARVLRRSLDIPSRGLPKAQTCREPFDETFNIETDGVVWLTNFRSKNFPHGMRWMKPQVPCELPAGDRKFRGLDPGRVLVY